jgi:hypothetical protein
VIILATVLMVKQGVEWARVCAAIETIFALDTNLEKQWLFGAYV